MNIKSSRWPIPLSIVTLALLAVWPVWQQGLPTIGDGQLHFYRLAELDWAIQHGQLYPRWLPDLGYGFGMPVFNFYPPLSYWLAEIWVLAGGLSLPVALQMGYLLAFITLTSGAYAWVQAVFDSPTAGMAAAAASSFAPYMFLNLLHRGAYPELWGLALAPWCLWAGWRLAYCNDTRYARLAASTQLAALVGTLVMLHALSAFLIIPLLLLYLLLLLGRDWQRWIIAGTALGLAAGLSAAFWWPVLQEQQFVQLSRTVGAGTLDFRNNFPTLAALFGPPQIFDPLRTFNPIQPGLNWIVLVLALWGLAAGRTRRDVQFAAIAALILLLLALPLSLPVWEAIPPLQFVQFPWRLVGPLSLMLALLAGGGVSSIRWPGTLPIFALGVILFALPWTFAASPLDLSQRTQADIPAYEQATGQLGTTATGEYLNIWASRTPDPAALAGAYASGALPPARLDHASLPSDVVVHSETPGFDHTTITYTATHEFDAGLHWLFFPDVQAEVDGQPLAVSVNTSTGMVQLADIPAGEHTLRVWRVASGPQRVGNAVSIASVLILLGLAGLIWHWRPTESPTSGKLGALPDWRLASVGGVALLVIGLRVVWLDVSPSPFYHSRFDGETVRGTTPQAVNFGNQVQLIGVEVTGPTVELYWQPLANLDTDYSVAVFYVDAADYRYGQHDNQHPGGIPSSRWQLKQYAQDSHPIAPLPGTPPGEYRLLISVYSSAGALEVFAGDGPVGQLAEVGTFTLPPADRPPTLDELAPQYLGGHTFGNFVLLGYEIDRPAAAAGQPFYVTLYWQALQSAPPGTQLTIALRQGQQTFPASLAPLTNRASDWQAGEVARGPQQVIVPSDVSPGPAEIVLQMEKDELVLGEIEILE